MGLNFRLKAGTGILFLFVSFSAFSQAYLQDPRYGDTEDARKLCASNLSTMSEFVKINMFDYAYDSWKYCFTNCPASSKNIYIMGARIIKDKIEKAANEEKANQYLDTLMLLYDKRIENFNQEAYVLGIKGIDLLKYKPSELQTGYEYLKKSLQLGKEKSSGAVLVTFVQASNILFKNNQKSADEFIADYLLASDYAGLALKSKSEDNLTEVISNIETIFAESGAADCDALIKIFTPKYEADAKNIELLKKITSFLDKAKCVDSELYAKSAESLYKLEPSAKAAYNLGNLFEVKGDLNKSKEYLGMAVEQETNPEDKAIYYYRIGAIEYKQGNFQEAKNNAFEAIKNKSDYGDAYILIGTAYVAGSSSCGGEAFDKLTVYWAAVDKFSKAKSVDPSVAEKASEMIDKYSVYFPNKEELFFRNLTEGMDYTVGCWIGERTTVRSKKG